jgi:hypothetical protein
VGLRCATAEYRLGFTSRGWRGARVIGKWARWRLQWSGLFWRFDETDRAWIWKSGVDAKLVAGGSAIFFAWADNGGGCWCCPDYRCGLVLDVLQAT